MELYRVKETIILKSLWATSQGHNTLDDCLQATRAASSGMDFRVDLAAFLTAEEWDMLSETLAKERKVFESQGSRETAGRTERRGLIIIHKDTGRCMLVDPEGTGRAAFVGFPQFDGQVVNVLRNAAGDGTCGGVTAEKSAMLVLDRNVKGADVRTENIYDVLTEKPDTSPSVQALCPLAGLLRGLWQLFGGNFVWGSGEDFAERFGGVPIAVYDREQ